jgi:hypothetical protein
MKDVAMKRLSLLLFLAMTPPALAQNLDTTEKRAVVEKAGEMLTASYIFPERASEAKAKIDAALAAGSYDAIAEPQAFAEKLTADLQSVTRDKHMRVFFTQAPPSQPPVASGSPPPRQNAGFVRVDRLKGNIGYIKVVGFPPSAGPFAAAANQAMADLAGTDALIIDMRDNSGGSPDGVAYLCSFFFDSRTPVHINSFINRKAGTNEFTTQDFHTRPVPTSYLGKPVYVLTSKRTFSGGEEFVYDIQTQKRGRLLGEVTGGGANPGGTRPLNSRFAMFVPGGRALNPVTKTNWEGTGVTPDVITDEKLAFQAAMREIVASSPRYAALKSAVEGQSEVDFFVEVDLMKFRTKPLAGGEAAVRRMIAETLSGKPDYSRLSDGLAEAVRTQLDMTQMEMKKLGEIRSVKFVEVGPGGLDVYEVTGSEAKMTYRLYVSEGGRVETAAFSRPQTLQPQ